MIRNILIGLGILVFILIIILAFVSLRKPKPTKLTFPKEPVTLTYWRLFDDKEVFEPLISAYKSQRKNVTIKYIKKEYETYEEDLIDALAAGKGPDIFILRADWLPKHFDKLTPMPEGMIDLAQYKEAFVKTVSNDLIFDDKIYGMPLSVDSLALYYNPSLFEEALSNYLREHQEESEERITEVRRLLSQPPENWTDFIEVVKLLTQKDERGNIKKAGAALGRGKNVAKAADILSLLMLQNNTQMTTADKKTATFNLPIKTKEGNLIYPGTSALDFYTSFARPKKETYTWPSDFPDSISAFGQGKVAMIFHYSYWLPLLKKQYPNLRFEVAPMPQIKGVTERVDYAYYWVEVVSKNTQYPQVAWDFLKFLGSKEIVKQYNQLAQRPYSRQAFSQEEMGGGGLSVFSAQSKTALSWYKTDPQKVENIFNDMIEAVVEKNQPLQEAIDTAAASITNLLQGGQPLIKPEEEQP